ncbi:MAG: FAD-dependent oxidoreductase [Promethearchaeota archaeon]
MPKITDPIKFGKMELENRYVAAPMLTDTLTEDGCFTERYLKTMSYTAQGGWGLVMVQATAVHPSGTVVRNELAAYDDKHTAGLYEIADAIKREGPHCGIQIFHGGAIAHPLVIRRSIDAPPPDLPLKTPVAPSPLNSFLNPAAKCHVLTHEEILGLIDCYGAAAGRAKEAGFECVEVHACHGSLPHQFRTPRCNTRTDEWGQDKHLFIKKIAEAVRKNVGPDFPFWFRISADDHAAPGTPGYTLEDTATKLVPDLEKAGVAAIHSSSGSVDVSGIWVIQPLYWEQGCLVKEAKRLKEAATVPVGTVGKIMAPEMAARIIEEESADWIALGRPAWADPWYPKKHFEGRPEDVRRCIACDWCTYLYILANVPARCSVNYSFGREIRYPPDEFLTPAEIPKDVLVIGGGVAGMETARVATLRGHNVTLYEKRRELGGIMRYASDIPYLYTGDLMQIATWQMTQLEKLGVEIKLGEEVSVDLVDKLNPDVVVVATGGVSPKPTRIPGIGRAITFDEYLMQKPELGQDVVVLGGYEGAEAATSIGKQDKNVTLVSESDSITEAAYFFNIIRVAALTLVLMPQGNVKTITNAKIKEITADSVRIEVEGAEQVLKADSVVTCFPREPVRDLYSALKGKVPELYHAGDCVKAGATWNAIDDGNWIGRKI